MKRLVIIRVLGCLRWIRPQLFHSLNSKGKLFLRFIVREVGFSFFLLCRKLISEYRWPFWVFQWNPAIKGSASPTDHFVVSRRQLMKCRMTIFRLSLLKVLADVTVNSSGKVPGFSEWPRNRWLEFLFFGFLLQKILILYRCKENMNNRRVLGCRLLSSSYWLFLFLNYFILLKNIDSIL